MTAKLSIYDVIIIHCQYEASRRSGCLLLYILQNYLYFHAFILVFISPGAIKKDAISFALMELGPSPNPCTSSYPRKYVYCIAEKNVCYKRRAGILPTIDVWVRTLLVNYGRMCICTCVRSYVCVCICMYVCMYVCWDVRVVFLVSTFRCLKGARRLEEEREAVFVLPLNLICTLTGDC